jgi:tetratricopeptide (TPR) repeat protein
MSKAKHDDDLLLTGMRLDERAGPARRISRDQSLAMIESALDVWQGELPVAPKKRSWLPAVAVAASLFLAMVGGASAARWYFGKAEPKPVVTSGALSENAVRRAPHKTSLPPVTLEAEPLEQEREEPSAPRRSQVLLARGPARFDSAAHEKAEPEDLLQRANRLRAEGRFQSAADTYAQVYERYPRSLSAYAAQVAAASIDLEHLAKPDRARKLFESALRSHPRGALDLEARQGLSLSLRELGRDRDEASSLRALIRDHGESPAARRAEARLKELAEGP